MEKKEKGPNGGARPGAGRPPGKAAKTIEKEAAREHLRQRVIAKMDPMIDAQIANAQGINFLVIREKKSGKFVKRITEAEGDIHLEGDKEIVEVWAKDPSVQAFTDLFNRALDKPAEPEQTMNLKMPAMEAVLERLFAGRKRVEARGKA